MPTRTATTAWTGSLQRGSGRVELRSSGIGTYDVSFPKRAADDADGTTSPEELLAAAHSACFAMSLSTEVAQAGGTPNTLDVRADVSLGPDPADGFLTPHTALFEPLVHRRVAQAPRPHAGFRSRPDTRRHAPSPAAAASPTEDSYGRTKRKSRRR